MQIQSRTGHRSLQALRLYERPTDEQQQAVSNILTSGGPQREFGKEMVNLPSKHTAQNVLESSSSNSGFSGALFGNLSNCSNFVINVNQGPRCNETKSTAVEQEFDDLMNSVDFQY